jgi:hypothetical protein
VRKKPYVIKPSEPAPVNALTDVAQDHTPLSDLCGNLRRNFFKGEPWCFYELGK